VSLHLFRLTDAKTVPLWPFFALLTDTMTPS
jgi:hypothetical protein